MQQKMLFKIIYLIKKSMDLTRISEINNSLSRISMNRVLRDFKLKQ